MSASDPAENLRRVANFIITALTDATIYVQGRLEATTRNLGDGRSNEADRARSHQNRLQEYKDVGLVGDAEAEEGC
jgi:hypothetical protein